jgi:hypothetical protein
VRGSSAACAEVARGPGSRGGGARARTHGDSKRRGVPKHEGRADAAQAVCARAHGGGSGRVRAGGKTHAANFFLRLSTGTKNAQVFFIFQKPHEILVVSWQYKCFL